MKLSLVQMFGLKSNETSSDYAFAKSDLLSIIGYCYQTIFDVDDKNTKLSPTKTVASKQIFVKPLKILQSSPATVLASFTRSPQKTQRAQTWEFSCSQQSCSHKLKEDGKKNEKPPTPKSLSAKFCQRRLSLHTGL